MITPDNVNERWYGQPGSGMRRVLEQLGGYDPDYQRVLWSTTKERKEVWHRCTGGAREWILSEVYPGREWRDRFMAATIFVPDLLGLTSEMPWAVNGRRNAVNAPNAAAFTAANEIGGGLSLNVIAGGSDDDYTAIHWGGNYPVMLRKSPHYHCTLSPEQTTQVAFMAGLVDSSRSTGTDAFGLPKNAVIFHFDTDIDTVPHYIIRSNGVDVINVAAAATPTAEAHVGVHIQTSEDGEYIRFIFGGSVVVDWVDVSGAAYADLRAARLQPIFTAVNRAAGQLRQLHLHDFRLIEDRGF